MKNTISINFPFLQPNKTTRFCSLLGTSVAGFSQVPSTSKEQRLPQNHLYPQLSEGTKPAKLDKVKENLKEKSCSATTTTKKNNV